MPVIKVMLNSAYEYKKNNLRLSVGNSIAAAFNYKKILNLHTVITLFDEDKIVHNF